MLNTKRIIGIIPARGGSKGIPRKNIVPIAGKPLIAWTIQEAQKSKFIDELILSSDDDEIIQVARNYGCNAPFKRPIELAKDDSPGIAPIIHALKIFPNFDYVVLLQPTSPLRRAEDIDNTIEACLRGNSPSCVTVSPCRSHPYLAFTRDSSTKLLRILNDVEPNIRRQDFPQVFELNGAVYVARTDWLLKSNSFISEETVSICMPEERSIDIDSNLDLLFAEMLLGHKRSD